MIRQLVRTVRKSVRESRQRGLFPMSVLHKGVSIDGLSSLEENTVLFANVAISESSLGRFTYIQAGSVVSNCEIGAFCSIASNVHIGLAKHPTNMISTSPVFYDPRQPLPKFFVDLPVFSENMPRTFIGSDVWIGQGSLINAGVTIGVGAVIGAGSIVTKDIEPYTIAAGTPCRAIRKRFGVEVCDKLAASHWWELDDASLTEVANYFDSPEELLEKLFLLKKDGKPG